MKSEISTSSACGMLAVMFAPLILAVCALVLVACKKETRPEDIRGACVYESGQCDLMSGVDQPDRCEALGGTWLGAGTSCTES